MLQKKCYEPIGRIESAMKQSASKPNEITKGIAEININHFFFVTIPLMSINIPVINNIIIILNDVGILLYSFQKTLSCTIFSKLVS